MANARRRATALVVERQRRRALTESELSSCGALGVAQNEGLRVDGTPGAAGGVLSAQAESDAAEYESRQHDAKLAVRALEAQQARGELRLGPCSCGSPLSGQLGIAAGLDVTPARLAVVGGGLRQSPLDGGVEQETSRSRILYRRRPSWLARAC